MDIPATQPKPLGLDMVKDAPLLEAGRYGTREMCDIWGNDSYTYLSIMEAQSCGLETLDRLYPGKIPRPYIDALKTTANFEYVDPDHIRALELKGSHDVIAINTAWGEAADKVTPGSSSVVNFLRTSADSTETGKAVRCMRSFQVFADSVENLRDIALEKSVAWSDIPWMDQTHLYDALPTFAGRPFSFYAEMLASDLAFIRYVHDNSLIAKWADATGNHHSAVSAGIDGMRLQEEYARDLGLRCMTAPAQVPGREFNADIIYALARTASTMAGLGLYVRQGRGDDRGTFTLPVKRKGSSGMPHKDIKGGNPIDEEQAASDNNYLMGNMSTALATVLFDYGRDLSASASDRLIIGGSFKFADMTARKMANVVSKLLINRNRSVERVLRSYGIVTAEQVMTYLVDPQRTPNPMTREDAHNLMAQQAQKAWDEKRSFFDVLTGCETVTTRIDSSTLKEITDPIKYVGQSREIIERNYQDLHGRPTFF